jgi:homocysteine S-methyltransferase
MDSFRNVLDSDRIHVVDGAMGTMLYAKGVYINRCYDELNLSSPDLVAEIHTEYIRAGADIIETNTFGATAHKLQQYGLEANMHEINARAAQIARKAAGDRAYVAGAIGPLGLRIEPYGPTSFAEAKEMFKAQATALLEGGVELFCLETFSDVSEIRQAIAAIRELCDLRSSRR